MLATATDVTVGRPPAENLDYRILKAVTRQWDRYRQRAGFRQAQLARVLEEPETTVSKYVRAMIADGLLERAEASELAPTAKGRAWLLDRDEDR